MNNNKVDKNNKIALFEKKEIRKIWYKNEWYFSVVDIIGVLTESSRPRKYWNDLKIKLNKEGSKLSGKIGQLKIKSSDGKLYKTDVLNTENILRLIQSIPSPKAEPFKRWLAKVGYERIEEIENPELAQERMKKIYEEKGYPKDWVDKRVRGIAIRQNLTDEWKERGISSPSDYAILTAEISKATFGMTPSEYRKYKNIPEKSKINLRDNMTDLELIFTMLGERVTTEISKKEEPEGMVENKKVAKRGGKVAGNARSEAEKEIGDTIVNKGNYLN